MAGYGVLNDVEIGINQKDDKVEHSIMDDFCYANNVASANIYIRMGFLRKVYGLLAVQLLITTLTAVTGMFLVTPHVKAFIVHNDWLLSIAFLLTVVILIALHIKRKETPINFILLTAFTIVQAYTVSVVVIFYDQSVVLQAFILTSAIVTGLAAYAFQTKRDFTSWGVGLMSALLVLIIVGFMQLFLGSSLLELAISAGGALLFSFFIVYDLQLMMTKLSPEEYIIATINLYLDIVNLFLYILRFLEAVRRK